MGMVEEVVPVRVLEQRRVRILVTVVMISARLPRFGNVISYANDYEQWAVGNCRVDEGSEHAERQCDCNNESKRSTVDANHHAARTILRKCNQTKAHRLNFSYSASANGASGSASVGAALRSR